jgi:hypothetical protein
MVHSLSFSRRSARHVMKSDHCVSIGCDFNVLLPSAALTVCADTVHNHLRHGKNAGPETSVPQSVHRAYSSPSSLAILEHIGPSPQKWPNDSNPIAVTAI